MTSLDQNGKMIDLHNNYDCISINYEKEAGSLNIVFEQSSGNQSVNSKVCIVFKDVTIVKFDFTISSIEDLRTIISFYRGRFENNGKAIECSSNGERYYYLEFENGTNLELFSKNVRLLAI